MKAKLLMLQGTGSYVGKSTLVAALCRIFYQDGWRVAPFKSQNMALNSYVTSEGLEMGRAQVVQAWAAGLEPHVDMNPILIKPEADARSQVVVMGKPAFTISARDYYKKTDYLLSIALEALDRLCSSYELVVVEGAGSPVEINLKEREIVNMRVARLAGAPVLLVGDIDKGGVFASLVGTLALLDDEERPFIKGFIINKFRGDIEILKPGLEQLERLTSVPVLGVMPYIHGLVLGEEDSIYAFRGQQRDGNLNVAVIHLPHISNSTDFEPLQQEEGVSLRYVRAAWELGEPHIIILPGSKSTISDLETIRASGLANLIVQKASEGVPLLGICGGFQMLGRAIKDPFHVESSADEVEGLGMLEMETVFEKEKTTRLVKGKVACNHGFFEGAKDIQISGYEIHMGKTIVNGLQPFCNITSASGDPHADGAIDEKGLVFGTYIHGLFDSSEFRRFFLNSLRRRSSLPEVPGTSVPGREESFNRLADLVRQSLKMEEVYRIIYKGI